jgi:GH15 family glucan-1,4-alpha-glucosidase
VRDEVLGQLRPDGSLPQSTGATNGDATALWLVIYRLLPRRDQRAHRLVDATLAELSEQGCFLRRYPPMDDGFAGVEGAFVPCSWWAVSALAALGRVDEAEARADDLCTALPRLLPEEWAGEALGNAPLVWSHAECARAMYLLTSAGVEARWGRVGHAAWRIGRLVRLVTHR